MKQIKNLPAVRRPGAIFEFEVPSLKKLLKKALSDRGRETFGDNRGDAILACNLLLQYELIRWIENTLPEEAM